MEHKLVLIVVLQKRLCLFYVMLKHTHTAWNFRVCNFLFCFVLPKFVCFVREEILFGEETHRIMPCLVQITDFKLNLWKTKINKDLKVFVQVQKI